MPGWDAYLSERDKKHDELIGKKKLFGFGEKPALLLIDFFYSAQGLERLPLFESMKTWPYSVGLEGWAAVDKTAELLTVARANGVPVIHVKNGLDPNIPNWFHRREEELPFNPGLSSETVRKSMEIVEEVAPREGEVVIEKATASAFWGTPLLFHLKALGVDTLLVTGETTSGCVRASVVDGATNRYRMSVVEECVADRTEASHWINLYDMHQKYADVVSLDLAKSYLGGSANRSETAA